VRTAALESAKGLEAARPIVLEALASEDLALRGTAVGLLEPATRPDDRERLAATWAGSKGTAWVEVRESIVDALAADPAAQALLARIAAEDEAPSVRDRAAAALARSGSEPPPPTSVPVEESPFLGVTFDEDPVVVLETTRGTFEIRCLAQEAPIHVAHFVRLVQDGFYDGLIWHRVVPGFVVQGGDPRGDGWGSGDLTLRDEINRVRFERGTVGMPKAGKDTGGCQLFVTHVPTPHLDGNYTVFGRVERGLDVIDRLEVGDRIVSARLR
jgi:cyclophilin family peptidyl-prolyl cis-trans isomerase